MSSHIFFSRLTRQQLGNTRCSFRILLLSLSKFSQFLCGHTKQALLKPLDQRRYLRLASIHRLSTKTNSSSQPSSLIPTSSGRGSLKRSSMLIQHTLPGQSSIARLAWCTPLPKIWFLSLPKESI